MALHASCFPAQAVSSPSEPSTAPANTPPSRRSDSRRGTDSPSDLENSSNRWSMINPSLHKGKQDVFLSTEDHSSRKRRSRIVGHARTAEAACTDRTYIAARAAVTGIFGQVHAVASAERESHRAVTASPIAAVGRHCGAYVAA